MATVRTHLIVSCATTLLMAASVYRRPAGDLELPNRIPEAAPYVTAEAESVPPPFEDFWQQLDHPAQWRNTDSGKAGVACMVCHSAVATRETPFHNYARSGGRAYVPASGIEPRGVSMPPSLRDILEVPDQSAPNLGYSIGGGSFQLSPHAVGTPDRAGPLTIDPHAGIADRYLSGVFRTPMQYEQMDASKHSGFRQVFSTRAEFCSACHDVTNPLTIKNRVGKWVGGFPIERTYAEWSSSRYADRPGTATSIRRSSPTARPATCSKTTGSLARPTRCI